MGKKDILDSESSLLDDSQDNLQPSISDRFDSNPVAILLRKVISDSEKFVPRQELEKELGHLRDKMDSNDDCVTHQELSDKVALLQSEYANSKNLKWLVGLGIPAAITIAVLFIGNWTSDIKEDLDKMESRLQSAIKSKPSEDKVRLILEERIAKESANNYKP